MTPLSFTRPDVLLRLEGLIALVVGCIAYQKIYPSHWELFALLFLAPDVALIGYLSGKGSAAFYNLLTRTCCLWAWVCWRGNGVGRWAVNLR